MKYMQCFNLNRIVSILLTIAFLFGTTGINLYSYAGQYEQYDTIPINDSGTEGQLAKAEVKSAIASNEWADVYDEQEFQFNLITVPYGTSLVKFYDEETNMYYSPFDYDLIYYDYDTYNENGWWTINTKEMSDGSIEEDRFSHFFAVKAADCYCKEASYYELMNEAYPASVPMPHFFIQVGDKDSPLDVFAKLEDDMDDYYGWSAKQFTGDKEIRLVLGAGKRHEIFDDTKQTIWYTTDGSEPETSQTAVEYIDSEVLRINKSCTIKAAAKVSDDVWGPVSSFNCTISCSVPEFAPTEGSYYAPFDISMESNTEGSSIYYTLDGSNPLDSNGNVSENAVQYDKDKPVHISTDTVVKAVAINSYGIASEVVTSEYRLSTGIRIDIDGDDQGVWHLEYSEHNCKTDKSRMIITPYGHAKCRVIASADESAELELNGQIMERETTGEQVGKYILDLDVLANPKYSEYGKENEITVTNGTLTDTYMIYCVAPVFDNVPDAVVDYFVPASQYTNGDWYGGAPNKSLICQSSFQWGVSLGNFGGYITWYYKDGIKDDPNNPYGVDFKVFGNSFDGTNEAAEPGNILVSENGKQWYSLAGSLHYDDTAIWNQKVTYTPAEDGERHYKYANYKFEGVINKEGTHRFLFPDPLHYPLHTNQEDFTSFTTMGTYLIPEKGVNEFGNTRPTYPAFGYADVGYGTGDNAENDYRFTNKAENPYGGIIRDKDYELRMTINRQGDDCDIAWAVDENGRPANLKKIHYIKVQTATFIDNGPIGEKSTEVNGMCVVPANNSSVGTTAAPSSIKIDGTNMDLRPGEIVNANVSGVFDVAVDAPEDTNVYINSLRSHTAFMKEAPHDIVRVIVQEGEKAPVIYYFNIQQDTDSKTVTKVTFDPGKGLLQDKEKVDCYFNEDTFTHAEDGAIRLPEAAPMNGKYGFLNWYEKDDETKTYAELKASDLDGTDVTLCAKFVKAEDAKAVKKVIAMIEALPEAVDVTVADSAAITEAREAYDALTDDQKALVEQKYVTRLEALEAAVISKVETMIDALPAPDEITEDDAEAVKAAKEAFDSLSDTAKAAISSDKTSKLFQAAAAVYQKEAEAAEDKAKDLQGELTQAKTDLAAAKETVSNLQTQLTKAQSDLQDAKDSITELQGTVSTLQGQVSEAQQAVKDAQAKYNALKAESDADKAELAQAKADLADAKAAEAQAKKDLKQAQDDLADAKTAKAEAESKLKQVQDDLADAKAAQAEAESKLSQIQKDLEEAKTKAETAQGDADKLEEENAILKEKNAVLSKTVKKAKAKAKKKSALVSWKSAGKGFKYEVYRSTNPTKSFKKVKTTGKLKVTVKKLKKGKTYYFKVRAFKKIDGKKVYTGYSNMAKVKIKK